MRHILHALLLSAPLALGAQTQLHVAPTGSDATGNGSSAAPYATIAKAAAIANTAIQAAPTTPVDILVHQGLYRNPGFSTTAMLSPLAYDPVNAGEPIWKSDNVQGTTVRLNNLHGNPNAWITIKPFPGDQPTIEGDGDITFSIRSCSYIRVQGLEIRGISDSIPTQVAWQYWGTYRYLSGGSYIYGDRKQDICNTASISPCIDIPPVTLTTGITYTGLPDISALNVERPSIFGGKGLLVQLSHHIQIHGNHIHHFPGGGLRVTSSDYVDMTQNDIHHNSGKASVGTHGLVLEGLEPRSGDNLNIQKALVAQNTIHHNYNELYSWVQSKTICTTHIDEGKGMALLRTSPAMSGFNGHIRVENNIAYANGKSGLHANDVENAAIINNTVFDNGYTNIHNPSLTGGNQAGISIQSSSFIQIHNNIAIVANGLSPALKAYSEGQNCTNITVSHNIALGGTTSDWPAGHTVTDPMLANPALGDAQLQPGSPAINAALPGPAPTHDHAGTPRDANPDIGAFEFTAPMAIPGDSLPTPDAPGSSDLQAFPNPCSQRLHIRNHTHTPRLFSADGREIDLRQRLSSQEPAQATLDVQGLPHGIYLLKAGHQTIKLILGAP